MVFPGHLKQCAQKLDGTYPVNLNMDHLKTYLNANLLYPRSWRPILRLRFRHVILCVDCWVFNVILEANSECAVVKGSL